MPAPSRVVLDAGALIAAEARAHAIWSFHEVAEPGVRELIVISPVVSQVWREGARQALLAKFLRRCVIASPDLDTAKTAGALLGRAGASDAVDALVVATAIAVRAKAILTSDVKDLEKLCGVANVKAPPLLEPV